MLNIKSSAGNRPVRIKRNLAVAVVVMGGLLGGSAYAYSWYQTNYAGVPQSTVVKSLATTAPSVKPSSGKVRIALQVMTDPAKPGEKESVNVGTASSAKCTIEVAYVGTQPQKTPAGDPDLSEKIADKYGTIGWTWTIPPTAPKGKGKVTVACSNATDSKTVTSDFTVGS
jgi:hypothetical protein